MNRQEIHRGRGEKNVGGGADKRNSFSIDHSKQRFSQLAQRTVLFALLFQYNLQTSHHFYDTELDAFQGSASPAAQYDLPSRSAKELRDSEAVEKAVLYLLHLQQPDGVILTSADKNEVVPMDNAHAALALSKVGHVAEGEKTVDWFLSRMTQKDDPTGPQVTLPSGEHVNMYTGSWYDQYYKNGEVRKNARRGRGESVGLMLIAIDSLIQADPEYISHQVNGRTVGEYMEEMCGYLERIQEADGTFVHRPDYREHFVEENVRMYLGLTLSAKHLRAQGKNEAAGSAMQAADRAYAALEKGDNYSYGMAYDYEAEAMWGVGSKADWIAEMKHLREKGLLRGYDVQSYDWRSEPFSSSDWLRLAAENIPNGTAETLDAGIAYLMIGDSFAAENIEQTMLSLQQSDGGFYNKYLWGMHFSRETIYNAARFIMFMRMLSENSSPPSDPVEAYHTEDQKRIWQNREQEKDVYTKKDSKKLLETV